MSKGSLGRQITPGPTMGVYSCLKSYYRLLVLEGLLDPFGHFEESVIGR